MGRKINNADGKVITLIITLIVLAAIFFITKNSSASTPKSAYLDYKSDFDEIKTFDDYVDAAEKHGTKDFIAEISSYRDSMENVPESLRATIIDLVKSVSPPVSEIKEENFNEIISNDKAAFEIKARDGTIKGDIIMLKVGRIWKVEKEQWLRS